MSGEAQAKLQILSEQYTALKDLLAEISDVRPTSTLDPENDNQEAGTGSEGEEDAAKRDHYVDVGASQLRRRVEAMDEDPKYSGKKVSRSDLYGDGLAEDESMDEEELDEDEELDQGSESGSEEQSEEQDIPDEASTDGDVPATRSKSKAVENDALKTIAAEERSITKQLKQAASADLDKGRDVKKQLSMWDTIVEARIKMQKPLSLVDDLPRERLTGSELSAEQAQSLTDLQNLSEQLFDLREGLMKSNADLDAPTKKRKRPDDFEGALSDLQELATTYEPFLKTTISKWSDKVSAATNATLKNRNKFSKVQNANTWQQIEHTLAADGEKLLSRARKNEEGLQDVEQFDDADFYQALLKEVVENQLLDLDDPSLAALRNATNTKKAKKVVDTKASKGRKLRYHVHEKLQNFMVPIPNGTWGEQQTQELFSSLFGRRTAPAEEEEIEAAQPEADLGGLTIFG